MKIKPSGSGGWRRSNTLTRSLSPLSLSLFILAHSFTLGGDGKPEIRGLGEGVKPIFSKGVCGGAKSDGKSAVFFFF